MISQKRKLTTETRKHSGKKKQKKNRPTFFSVQQISTKTYRLKQAYLQP